MTCVSMDCPFITVCKNYKLDVDWGEHCDTQDQIVALAAAMRERATRARRRCSFGDGITIKPDGIHELSPHLFREEQVVHNVTIQVLRCVRCGETSIAWLRQPDTYEEK